MKRGRRVIIVRICAALVLGLVTSISIAWVVAARHIDFGGTTTLTSYSDDQGGWTRSSFGMTHISVTNATWTDGYKAGARALAQRWVLLPAIETVNRTFETGKRSPESEDWVVAAGWPWRCAWCHAQQSQFWLSPTLAPGDPSINLTPAVRSGERKLRVLPLRPLWLGLIGNMLFYSAFWFLLLSIPALYRTLRRRKGCCAKCGYNLKGIGSANCPECGAATAATAVAGG